MLSEDDFNRLNTAASLYIDSVTFNRIRQKPERLTDDVRHAVCAVAETMKRQEQVRADGGPKKSESVGSQSITRFGNSEETPEAMEERQRRQCAERYLINTGLLYRGF